MAKIKIIVYETDSFACSFGAALLTVKFQRRGDDFLVLKSRFVNEHLNPDNPIAEWHLFASDSDDLKHEIRKEQADCEIFKYSINDTHTDDDDEIPDDSIGVSVFNLLKLAESSMSTHVSTGEDFCVLWGLNILPGSSYYQKSLGFLKSNEKVTKEEELVQLLADLGMNASPSQGYAKCVFEDRICYSSIFDLAIHGSPKACCLFADNLVFETAQVILSWRHDVSVVVVMSHHLKMNKTNYYVQCRQSDDKDAITASRVGALINSGYLVENKDSRGELPMYNQTTKNTFFGQLPTLCFPHLFLQNIK